MYAYQKIHFWELPPTKIGLALREKTRNWIITQSVKKIGSQYKLAELLNKKSKLYGKQTRYSHGTIYSWKRFEHLGTLMKSSYIPLWALLEMIKLLNPGGNARKSILLKIEEEIDCYKCYWSGTYHIKKPKLPIVITPELTSVVFNFCGDGHLSFCKHVMNSYRQMNHTGLRRVYEKIQNSFGEFELCPRSFKDGKLEIPRVIGELYKFIFGLGSCRWDEARIPEAIKTLPAEFLLAGLVAFIIDEGSIGEVIQIYSKNSKLLADIHEIAQKLKYRCLPIRQKYHCNSLDCYRFSISPKSYLKMDQDIKKLTIKFPTCDFAHKTRLFEFQVNRIKRGGKKRKDGIGLAQITDMLKQKQTTTNELMIKIGIGKSSLRALLTKLESQGIIRCAGLQKRRYLWELIQK